MTVGVSIRVVAAAALALSFGHSPAAAHAFGARYDLPLPLWLYLTGAGAAVALTFLLLALFARSTQERHHTFSINLPVLSRLFCNQPFRLALRTASVALFTLILLTGFLGRQDAVHNLAPTTVWVLWWVGFTFLVALVGNAWPVLSPWICLYDTATWATGRRNSRPDTPAPFAYPSWLGFWPSVLLLATFAWLELVSAAGERPRTLACLIVAYSLLTWAGMLLYGRDTWLHRGEAFHRYFRLVGQFAPFGTDAGGIVLRPYGAGLIGNTSVHISMTAFVILVLSTVTFDGFVETPVWADFLQWLSEDRTLRPLLIWLQANGIDLLAAVKTTALLLFPVLFLAVFWSCCAMSRAMAGGNVSTSELANTLVFSLIPIAIAYHVSHYLSYLLLAGQLIIPLASDPFGWGWDLFGTASSSMDIGIINAATVWYVAIIAIIIGHVIAVWVAHETALALYKDARAALFSQLPMLVLMVLYTMTSLWILSQPIVEV